MSIRDKYINLIKENQINNIFEELTDLSYSKKIQILKNLLDKFNVDTINAALLNYFYNYIDIKRVNYVIIESVLKGICKRLKNT